MKEETKAIIFLLAVIAAITIITLYGFGLIVETEKERENIACPKDSFKCPDGSFVGRSGLNCSFEECPLNQ